MARARTARSIASIAEPTTVLRTLDGAVVPLQGVTATGRLEGLVFELTVEQRYRNDTARNLEAVFTFPLPLRAVLLGVDLEIGERRLSAVAIARQEASERYERAIDQGDTAALVEHNGHGLYTVSLGNLLAGESATIRYRYAELLDAHHGTVRLNIPTVIAPRYGDPRDSGLEGPSVPGVDLLGEYPFEITLDLVRIVSVAGLRSPSHEIVTTIREDGLTVRLSRSGFLDRDFVLELDQAAIPTHALIAKDGDGYVALANATLGLDTAEQRPLALKILLDCSGSMGGDSIAAAKRALLAILGRLTPADRISLTRFGSSVEQVSEGLEPADEHSLTPLKTLVRQIEANLGGTEMENALQAALSLATPADRQADVILITDGEIYDVAGVVDLAAKSRHRLFAIAIGAAPNEALARSLADQTGGACEFVGPNEDAEAAILRTFKRLRSIPRTLREVQWPTKPDWTAPLPNAIFPGDTLHLLAGFTHEPKGSVATTVTDADGQGIDIHLPLAVQLTEGDLLPRLAAARRIGALDEAAARELAVKYQLATQYTSFVVVAQRAEGEKAADLPATVAVPHMLAAGWGGNATVVRSVVPIAESSHVSACVSIEEPLGVDRSWTPSDLLVILEEDDESSDWYTGTTDATPAPTSAAVTFPDGARRALLVSLRNAHRQGTTLPDSFDHLAHVHPLPEDVRMALRRIADDTGRSEAEVLAAFYALLVTDDAADAFDAESLRSLRATVLARSQPHRLYTIVRRELFQ